MDQGAVKRETEAKTLQRVYRKRTQVPFGWSKETALMWWAEGGRAQEMPERRCEREHARVRLVRNPQHLRIK